MAYDWSKHSTKELEAKKAANSEDWHGASKPEQAALHQQNIEIQKVLDSRKGTTSTFDSGTGKWSTTGGGSSAKNSGSSGGGGSGDSFSPSKSLGVSSRPYATDDHGRTDYSVLLQDAMSAGAGADEVQRLLGLRTDKALGDPSLYKYAYDNTYADAMKYIMDNQKPQVQQPDWQAMFQDMRAELESAYEQPDWQPSYWDQTKDALAKAALEMNYTDWTKSDQYKALADRYGLQGQLSMRDVLGQVSSRTGGLASSYAATAAQQQYNQYMSQLEQAAMEMYGAERADALENAQLAYNFADGEYQRYLDRLAQYNKDRGFGFDVLSAALGESHYQNDWKNTLDRQAVEDERYDRAQSYEQSLGKAALLAAAGNYSGYADLWGLTEEETAGLVNEYARQKQLSEAAAARELADWHAQYGDFSKLEGLGVDTSYLKQSQQGQYVQPTVQSQPTPAPKTESDSTHKLQIPKVMTRDEWEKKRRVYLERFQGPDEVVEYESYGDYIDAYNQYLESLNA